MEKKPIGQKARECPHRVEESHPVHQLPPVTLAIIGCKTWMREHPIGKVRRTDDATCTLAYVSGCGR